MSRTKGPWFVGVMNDCLFIIDQPPRPSNDDVNPDHDTHCITAIRRVPGDFEKESANANLIVAAPAYQIAWDLVPEDIKGRIFDVLHRPDMDWVEKAITKAQGK